MASEYFKKWYSENLDRERLKRKTRAKVFRETMPRERMLNAAKNRAKKSETPFDLTLEDIIIPNVCPILGTKFKHGTRYAASLDKIRPELGYVKGNVQVVSRKANVMKNDATEEELRNFTRWVQKTYPLL